MWNEFIQKISQKCQPESNGIIILGSAVNSDLCSPVPFAKRRLKSLLFELQGSGSHYNWQSFNNFTNLKLTPHIISKSVINLFKNKNMPSWNSGNFLIFNFLFLFKIMFV